MNTIGDAIAYAGAGVSYLADTIKYYVLGVPPAIPDNGDFVFVDSVTTHSALNNQLFDTFTVNDFVVSPDELFQDSVTEPETESAEPETESVTESAEPDDEPAMPPSLVVRAAFAFVLEELLDTNGQASL